MRLDAAAGRIRCGSCGGAWRPGEEEAAEHHRPGCLAAPARRRARAEPKDDRELRAVLAASGAPWPEPAAEMGGLRFSRVLGVSYRQDWRELNYLPPLPPSREVPDAADPDLFDDEGEPLSRMRRLTDEEWAAATARHAEAVAEWTRTGGRLVERSGPSRVEAEFVLEDGARARGVWIGRWAWLEWSAR